MVLKIENTDNKCIILFEESNRIDTTNLKLIKEQLTSIINSIKSDSTRKEVILDFSNINFIDSSGLTIVINLYKVLVEEEKTLEVINVNNTIKEVFTITKLDSFIKISS